MAPSKEYHCSFCTKSFAQKYSLYQHMGSHKEVLPGGYSCKRCDWTFDDSLQLENHYLQTGHDTNISASAANPPIRPIISMPPKSYKARVLEPLPQTTKFQCVVCKEDFWSKRAHDKHREFPKPCSDGAQLLKPGPSNKPKRPNVPNAPNGPKARGLVPLYKDLDAAPLRRDILRYESSDNNTDANSDTAHCFVCKNNFPSQHAYNQHVLRCDAKSRQASDTKTGGGPSMTTDGDAGGKNGIAKSLMAPGSVTSMITAGLQSPSQAETLAAASRPMKQKKTEFKLNTTKAQRPGNSNNVQGDQEALRNPATLTFDKFSAYQASTSVGPEAKDHYDGPRNTLKNGQTSLANSKFTASKGEATIANIKATATKVKAGNTNASSVPPKGQAPAMNTPTNWRLIKPVARDGTNINPTPFASNQSITIGSRSINMPNQVVNPVGSGRGLAVAHTPTAGADVDERADLAQAESMQGKIMRLMLQSDISILTTGKIDVDGLEWVRIRVAKQADLNGLFEKLCHLPKHLQREYLPAPKSLKSQYQAMYPPYEFCPPPDRPVFKSALDVVAISCSKIILADGRFEVVKLAAIDIITGRVLLNHLVCTDPKVEVKDWLTVTTGMSSFKDMEAARQAGYKIFRGWRAARAALFRFVDSQTIVVGHNLRSDFDALRIIYGRAVDAAKLMEKAAEGPLSTQQLSLESLCRDLTKIKLPSHPNFGRDSLQNAFAAREICLHYLKHKDTFVKYAKEKALEYQRINPSASV